MKMRKKKENNIEVVCAKKKKFRLWVLLVGLFACFVAVWPFYELLNLSLRGVDDFSSRLKLPVTFVWDNYVTAFTNSGFLRGLLNSVVYSGLTVVIEVLTASMAGYALSRGSAKTTKVVRAVQMTIIMVPGIVTLVGTYSMMVKLNMTNSLLALALLTSAGGIPTCSFIYMNFMNSIPISLDEAARIDGAGVFHTYFKIILPQLKAITITRTIMIAIGAWNNYLLPLYLINDARKKTIILVIRSAFSMTGGDRNLGLACATCALGICPILILYSLMQRKIIESQIGAGVKG